MAGRVKPRAVPTTHGNNFDALRLFGAILVLVSHAYPLSGRHEPTVAGNTFGTIGVFIFFGISGYLITKSWVREPRAGVFFAKRALRILPGLCTVSLITAYLVGPFVTAASPGHYLHDPLTLAYALRNATLRPDYVLPGVFTHNPYPRAVNGSLWTLPIEARAYVAVACIGFLLAVLAGSRPHLGWFSQHRRWVALGSMLLLTLGLVLATLKIAGVSDELAAYGLGLKAGQLTGGFAEQWYLLLAFAVGGGLYLSRKRIPLRWDAFAAIIVIWAFAYRTIPLPLSVSTALIPAVAIPYATLVVAFRGSRLLRKLTAWGDMSYGVYLWAFPVEQIVALKFAHATPGLVIAVALPVTCLLGAVSWLLVERHALRLKPGASSRSVPSLSSPRSIPPTPHDHPHPTREAALPVVGP